jgi:hypothetical protein
MAAWVGCILPGVYPSSKIPVFLLLEIKETYLVVSRQGTYQEYFMGVEGFQ